MELHVRLNRKKHEGEERGRKCSIPCDIIINEENNHDVGHGNKQG